MKGRLMLSLCLLAVVAMTSAAEGDGAGTTAPPTPEPTTAGSAQIITGAAAILFPVAMALYKAIGGN